MTAGKLLPMHPYLSGDGAVEGEVVDGVNDGGTLRPQLAAADRVARPRRVHVRRLTVHLDKAFRVL